MTPEQKSRFRALIHERLFALEGAAESKREHSRPVELDQTRVGRLSRQDALQAQAMSAAALERDRIAVARLKSAFTKINEGEYGWCEDCGGEIPVARLEIDPTADYCVSCAERHEDR